jgi:hypothetical protein
MKNLIILSLVLFVTSCNKEFTQIAEGQMSATFKYMTLNRDNSSVFAPTAVCEMYTQTYNTGQAFASILKVKDMGYLNQQNNGVFAISGNKSIFGLTRGGYALYGFVDTVYNKLGYCLYLASGKSSEISGTSSSHTVFFVDQDGIIFTNQNTSAPADPVNAAGWMLIRVNNDFFKIKLYQ